MKIEKQDCYGLNTGYLPVEEKEKRLTEVGCFRTGQTNAIFGLCERQQSETPYKVTNQIYREKTRLSIK